MNTETNEINLEIENQHDFSFDYQLLARLQQDCEYYLGYGAGHSKHLWAQSVDAQIEKMKKLWHKVPLKPEWLSLDQIESYEQKMKDLEKQQG